MASLTGYLGNGNGVDILNNILGLSPLNLTQPAKDLADNLFKHNFLPYATTHWPYNGVNCNCQMLSDALAATWTYIKYQTRTQRNDLPAATLVKCADTGKAVITNKADVLGGIANGNIRLQSTGQTDKRALFENHTVCQIGATFYDPTFMRSTNIKGDCILRILTEKPGDGAIYVARNVPGTLLYVLDKIAMTPGFGSSYHELNGRGWLSAQEWKTKTARLARSRSQDLQRVDAALNTFEQQGWSGLLALKTAFTTWAKHNPDEAKGRDADHCVRDMAAFLNINLQMLGVKII